MRHQDPPSRAPQEEKEQRGVGDPGCSRGGGGDLGSGGYPGGGGAVGGGGGIILCFGLTQTRHVVLHVNCSQRKNASTWKRGVVT